MSIVDEQLLFMPLRCRGLRTVLSVLWMSWWGVEPKAWVVTTL